MLKARNLSFLKLMTAGYISADAYRALQPKKVIQDLSFSDCYNYEYNICNELKTLFEDDKIIEELYCLERIEEGVSLNYISTKQILDECLADASDDIKDFVERVGEKVFLLEYVFCSRTIFRDMYYITETNFSIILKFANKVALKYKKHFKKPTGEIFPVVDNVTQLIKDFSPQFVNQTDSTNKEDSLEKNSVIESNGTFDSYKINAGVGFYDKDAIVIEHDALSPEKMGLKKYILFLYSLDKLQFTPFIDYFLSKASHCSVRLRNGINALGIRNFYINYLFADKSKFYQIRHFGKKSIHELYGIKQSLIDFVIQQYDNANTEIIEKEISEDEKNKAYGELLLKDKIGETQYSLLYQELKRLVNDASVRAQNGINNYSGDFIEDFVNKKKNITSIKNIGKKTEIEINDIIDHLNRFLQTFQERELSPEELLWMEKRNYYGQYADEYTKKIYIDNHRLPILHILDNCFKSMIKNRSTGVLNEVVPLFNGKEGKSLEEVGYERNLSRERVRQICNKEISGISSLFSEEDKEYIPQYHKILKAKEDWSYLLTDLNARSFWDINDLSELANQEECSLKVELLSLVISVVFQDSFILIGRQPISISSRTNGWNNTYLFDKRLADSFDFDEMLNIVDNYVESSSEPITMSAQELLIDTFYTAWKNYDHTIVNELEQAITQILINEKGLIPDINFKFTLEGKMDENPADVLYRLLSDNGNPLDLNSLYVLFEQEYPNKYKSPNSLRPIITRDPRICLMGVGNMVALIEWEHVQIGNIRELIVSYLVQFDEPQHFSKIVDYILSQRDTTERSIRSTMSSGEQFRQFPGGFYGLSDKTYPEWFYLTESERNSRKKIIEFEKFLREKEHYPFSPSDTKEEELLYQWWSRLNRQENISEVLLSEIKRIKKLYSDIPKNRKDYLWFKKCKEFEMFYKQNNRMPGSRNRYEVELSKWLNKSLNDSAEGKLSPERERALIKLCKSF